MNGDDREPSRAEPIRSDGWTEKRRAREEEQRGRAAGEPSFHVPSVWLVDDEGHYSRKGCPTLQRAAFLCSAQLAQLGFLSFTVT